MIVNLGSDSIFTCNRELIILRMDNRLEKENQLHEFQVVSYL